MAISITVSVPQLDTINATLNAILKETQTMSGNLTNDIGSLTAAITNLGSVVTTTEADITQVLSLLAGSNAAANDAAVQAAIAQLGTLQTELQAGVASMGSVISQGTVSA